MGKKASITEVQREQIVVLQHEGYSQRAISEELKCSKTAVHNAVVKFVNSRTGSSLSVYD